jgi:Mg2+ and Co2+ transporter CorA
MPAKKKPRRPKVPHALVAVVQPVTKRLSRIEDLLIEMRGAQDGVLKRISKVERQIDELRMAMEEQSSRASAAS